MKVCFWVVFLTFLPLPAFSSSQCQGACGAVLCLAGGKGLAECQACIDPFYAIEVFQNLLYDPRATLDARNAYLIACGSVDQRMIDEVNTSERRSDAFSRIFDVSGRNLTFREIWWLRYQYGDGIFEHLEGL